MRQNENKRIDKDENGLEDRVVAIKRVTKVVKGGRNMRFSALVVVGDGNGHVGAGLGKAAEIPEAIRKGKEDAQKHMISVARTDYNSVTHDTYGKFGGIVPMGREGLGSVFSDNMNALNLPEFNDFFFHFTLSFKINSLN